MTTTIDFSYRKNDNKILFANFEDSLLTNISKTQNYIPLYNVFFDINHTNYNNINLNQHFSLKSINKKIGYNKYEGILEEFNNKNSKIKKSEIFFKYSPLLDPIKYLLGKYEDIDVLNLPSLNTPEKSSKKISDPNNSAYVDSFFTYLTSKLLHNHGFLHAVDFYGSFLGIKHEYMCNIQDDMDCLYDSSFFQENNDLLYTFENSDTSDIFCQKNMSKEHRKPILIKDEDDILLQVDDIIQVVEPDLSQLTTEQDEVNKKNNEENIIINDSELLFEKTTKHASSSLSLSSSCSSRSSNTSINTSKSNTEDEDDCEDTDTESENEDNNSICEEEEEDEEEEEAIFVKIKDFPVQMIGLECCENTLDSLISDNDLNDDEWDSIVIQILMMLITYQKAFHLTHNDLHTNNVMYNKTDKDYLYYKINETYYKVPTYGRIFKIIDFGRAIYKFKGQVICSDSFHTKEGDAATQYNCDPYYNDKKPRIDPNFSFDLCRLGCSIFDFIIDEDEDDLRIEKIKSPILRMIAGWCKDDKGRNILYKTNGDERYPDFKLYKMIARKVHQHIPLTVLQNTYFDKYLLSNKKIIKGKLKEGKVMNIDDIPAYF